MDLSNRALGLLLIAAIVVSIGGTFISLNKLDAVSTTGFATNNVTGQVDVSINSSLSITMTDATIDFGNCGVLPGKTLTINSQDTGDNQTYCDGTFPDFLQVENDGNVNTNVTVRSNISSTNAFSAATSTLSYLTVNGSTDPGCMSGLVGSYAEFSAADTDYGACDNLAYGAANRFDLHAQIVLSETAQDESVELTFEGHLI